MHTSAMYSWPCVVAAAAAAGILQRIRWEKCTRQTVVVKEKYKICTCRAGNGAAAAEHAGLRRGATAQHAV